VFDGTARQPYKEGDPVSPLGEYGKSKYAGEEQVREALPGRHLIVRTAWLFGSYGHNFVKTMLKLGRERDQLRVVNDQTGGPTYAGHLAAALKALAETRLGDPGVYHMTGAGHCTWFEFAAEIMRLARVDVDLKRTTTAEFNAPAPRPAYSVLANTRAPEIVMPHWRDGLIECLREMGELHNESYARGEGCRET
jgi:dTDP-4-dehydrorhamnose reductase